MERFKLYGNKKPFRFLKRVFLEQFQLRRIKYYHSQVTGLFGEIDINLVNEAFVIRKH